ncbi:hypothetical protein [Novosphingobium resinovorum]|uniref:hypothetical protein n=1 Tax=Novosphingobium resinovorum TaxID=158500 RepID=UPI002ED2B596|nr:hypothetical protein [Novosphingobium resinovorum]
MSFGDEHEDRQPPRILPTILGLVASPISIALVLCVISWPFALGFIGLALPLCLLIGVPVALGVRKRMALSFPNCAVTGGISGFLTGLVIMIVAAMRDTYYEIGGSFFILAFGGVVCGGIAFPWIRWLDLRFPATGKS